MGNKKRSTKSSRLRLHELVGVIFEDIDLSKADASVQATLCNCYISDMNATTSRDACAQANLCHCSEYVGCNGGVGSVASQDSGIVTTVQSALVHLPHSTENLHVPEIAKKTCINIRPSTDKLMPVSTDSQRVVESNLKQSEVLDIEGVCNELEACYLDDTVAHEYVFEKSLLIGCNGSVADKSGGADRENVSNTACMSEPEASQEDSVLVSMYNVSLQTSAAENVIDTSITEGNQSSVNTEDALQSFDDKVNKSSLSRASSTASPLLPRPSDANGAEVVHSSDMFSDSCSKSVCCVSLHSSASDNLVGDMLESESTVVQEPDAATSDSILVSMHNVSLQTSALEDVIDIGARDLSDAETLPSFEDGLDAKSSIRSVGITANTFSPQPPVVSGDNMGRSLTNSSLLNSCKKSICSTSSDTFVSVKVVDEGFELGSVDVHAVMNVGNCEASDVPTFPDFDTASDQVMDMHTDGMEPDLLSDESVGEINYHNRPSSPDDLTSAATKILTSTTIDNPEPISDFFGLTLLSQSGSDHSWKSSIDGGRQKSKPGRRRVSMCGEVDSLTEFFMPHTFTAASTHEVSSTVADTDEEDNGTVPRAKLCITAMEEHLLDTACKTDEDRRCELMKSAAGGFIPDGLIEKCRSFPKEVIFR